MCGHRFSRYHPLLLALLAFPGCTEAFDQYWEVEDLRVLAIQAEPPELFIESVAPAGDPAFPTQVSFDALVVDPRGGRVNYDWTFCPVESSTACVDYDETIDEQYPRFAQIVELLQETELGALLQLDSQSQAEFETFYRAPALSDAADAPGQEGDPIRPHPTAAFSMPFPNADLHWFHTFINPFGTLVGSWPSAVIEARSGRMSVRSFKRLSVTFKDPALLLMLAGGESGVTICEPGQTPETNPGCLALDSRVTNRNPEFVRDFIEISPGESAAAASFCQPFHPSPARPCNLSEEDDAIWVDASGGLHLLACEAMRILPVFPDGSEAFPGYDTSFERWQSIEFNIDTETLHVRDQEEKISVSWFVTAGSIQEQLTWPIFTLTLDTAYSAPNKPPVVGGGLVTIWMVARDQRGGIAWQSLEIDIEDNSGC